MREQIRWTDNHMPPSGDRQLEIMSLANVAKARFFHSSFPQYSVTPLARLDGMARYLGLAGLFLVLTIVVKYLSLILKLTFEKQDYLVESIEKFQK